MNASPFPGWNRPALLFLTTTALSVLSATADQIEDAVTAIRARYNQIEAMQLDARKVEFESNSDPASGTLTKYFDKGGIVKANFSYVAGDHGGADETYYYHQGQVMFVFVSQSHWQFTGRTRANGESETTDVAVEHRLYFAPGTLIRHLRKEVKSTNPKALSGLLAKTENVPFQDPGLVKALVTRARTAPGIETPQALEQMFFQD